MIEHFRTSMLGLISTSYTSITPALANIYLCIEPPNLAIKEEERNYDHVIEVLKSRGWDWDAAQGLLIPVPMKRETEASTIVGQPVQGQNKMVSMDRLVRLVGFLGE
jgi:CSN8/PSMD8/EIF3K family